MYVAGNKKTNKEYCIDEDDEDEEDYPMNCD
jgi:hypothetical protein